MRSTADLLQESIPEAMHAKRDISSAMIALQTQIESFWRMRDECIR